MENAFYPVREIRDFKDLLNQSAELFGARPAFSLKKNGEYVDVTYNEFKTMFLVRAALNSLSDLRAAEYH